MFKIRCGRAIVATAITALGLFAGAARADHVCDFVSIVDLAQHDTITPTGSTLTVDDAGAGKVSFKVTNVTGASMVFNVYFDDATGLLSNPVVSNGPGVNFVEGGAPGNVPEFQLLTPPFDATSDFSATPPPSMNGLVNAGEFVTITFDLTDSHTLADVENALTSNDLRVAIHTPGGDGAPGSSGVTYCPIPTPAAAPMGLALLGGLALVRTRKA